MPVLFRTTGSLLRPALSIQRNNAPLRLTARPMVCAVIDRPDGVVLVDTGWSREQCAFPDENPGRVARHVQGLRVRPEDALASQLISLGFDPNAVKHIVPTDLRGPHIAALADFPNAVVHTTDEAWTAHRRERAAEGRDTAIAHDRVAVHGALGAPRLGFRASCDLFGDGSVHILAWPGRARTAVAVAIALEGREVVCAGARFPNAARYLPAPRTSWLGGLLDPDREALREALRTAHLQHGAAVVLSHDADGFASLPTSAEAAWRGAWDTKRAAKKRDAREAPRPGG